MRNGWDGWVRRFADPDLLKGPGFSPIRVGTLDLGFGSFPERSECSQEPTLTWDEENHSPQLR